MRIPYSLEQGIISADQGILAREQGILSAEIENHRQMRFFRTKNPDVRCYPRKRALITSIGMSVKGQKRTSKTETVPQLQPQAGHNW
jgi:hypothetical protein